MIYLTCRHHINGSTYTSGIPGTISRIRTPFDDELMWSLLVAYTSITLSTSPRSARGIHKHIKSISFRVTDIHTFTDMSPQLPQNTYKYSLHVPIRTTIVTHLIFTGFQWTLTVTKHHGWRMQWHQQHTRLLENTVPPFFPLYLLNPNTICDRVLDPNRT